MFNSMMFAHAAWGWGVGPACWVVVKLRSTELEAQSRGQAADAEKKLNSLIMSNDEGDSAGGSMTSVVMPTVETIIDSTIKVLLPQLSDKIEQQVSQAIKAALAAASSSG